MPSTAAPSTGFMRNIVRAVALWVPGSARTAAYAGRASRALYHAATRGNSGCARMSKPRKAGILAAKRDSCGVSMMSASEGAAPPRKGPPPGAPARAASKFRRDSSNATRSSGTLDSSRGPPNPPPSRNPKPTLPTPCASSARSMSPSTRVRSAVPAGGSSGGNPSLCGKACSMASRMSRDSYTSSPSIFTAGTSADGTMSRYHRGLFRRSMNTVSNGTPFSCSASHTRSQYGHHALVSRYSSTRFAVVESALVGRLGSVELLGTCCGLML
mmetsp:Transcript_5948/g.15140  ORF Transcript_5948/g.15140 Transcript_5948/m.15140 type:complete len:271 (-) Transcript_5948:306-1118(-)